VKRVVTLCAIGFGALWVQGGLAAVLPPPWCPDLSLLVVIGLGLRWGGFVSGLLMAAALGLAADVVSASLLGQHMLLRIGIFTLAFALCRRFNLRGGVPMMAFTASVSLGMGLVLVGVSGLASASIEVALAWAFQLVVHALVNALLAPAFAGLVERAADWAAADDPGRGLRFATRRHAA